MERWGSKSHGEPRALTIVSALAVILAVAALVGAIAVARWLLF
jgi:hypothetical protein